ncbi:hypothetical protein OYT1_ch1586 [Ferriphaselus amnicola]|uniref:Uncharacterized protein n=1 Tax=Ferriphaselus amnicola TaxID=1188319 RepID=A0A2Z6GC37_9PROT|nr:hypothetical protein [Ferriphaselus amnicola]BBE51133.1 hypothetical protein OYT1_ch1586 [Ferriphaselus amnicola]
MLNESIGLKTAIGPAIAGVVSYVFDIDVAVLIAAFAGSWMGVAISESMTVSRAASWIIGGTVSSGYLTPFALVFLGELPQRPAAAILGFFACHQPSREWLIEKVKSWINK